MGKLWLDPNLQSGFRFFFAFPGSDSVAKFVDGAFVPVQRLLGVYLNDATFQLRVPPHFLGLNYFEVVLFSLFDFVLNCLHDAEMQL